MSQTAFSDQENLEQHDLEQRDAVVFTAASAIGIIAGMRSMTAPAVVAHLAGSGCTGASRKDFGVLGQPAAKTTFMVLAAIEAIADKLPFVPNRTAPPALIGRLLIGAFCGATICSAMKRSPVVGALAGAFGAVGATFAAYQIRDQLTSELGLPDAAVAVVEDATALWAGKAICQGISLKGRDKIRQ